jgi:OOP family OmpA-OmpF porin
MTDLPADPTAWDPDGDLALDVGSARAAEPRVPAQVHADRNGNGHGDGGARSDAPPATAPRAVEAAASPPVAYDALTSLAPRAFAGRSLLGPFVGVALLALGLGFLLARTAGNGGASTSRTIVTPPPATVVATTRSPATAPAATTVPAAPTPTTAPAAPAAPSTTTATTVAPATTAAPPSTAAPAATPVSGVDVAAPVRWAEFRGGKVYLHGRVPSASVAATIVRKAAAVVGEPNVVQDYTVDPTTPDVAGGPLTVAETVQFDPDSAVVRPEFGRILELGVLLMTQNPAVRITVVGRADNRGPAEYNLQLSQQRAGAVVSYLTSRGIDGARLSVDARGAGDPLAPGDTEGDLQANRSVEFVILGLLD